MTALERTGLTLSLMLNARGLREFGGVVPAQAAMPVAIGEVQREADQAPQ
jgi:hypothetical protein